MPIIPFRSSFRRSKARVATSKASVESSPPEIPTTRHLQPVARRRCASPATWMLTISSQRRSISLSSHGTNGWGSIVRNRPGASSSSEESVSLPIILSSFSRSDSLLSGSRSSLRLRLICCTTGYASPAFSRSPHSANVPIWSRSRVIISMSMSRTTICGESCQRGVEARILPFSAIIPLPSKTRSVDDSPNPAEA